MLTKYLYKLIVSFVIQQFVNVILRMIVYKNGLMSLREIVLKLDKTRLEDQLELMIAINMQYQHKVLR